MDTESTDGGDFVLWLQSLVQFADEVDQGDDEDTAHQIANAMGNVSGEETKLPPHQRLLP